MNAVPLGERDLKACWRIQEQIRGYSGPAHFAFFKGVLSQWPGIKNVLVLGVYHGRDIALILEAAASLYREQRLAIVGVDKFSDTPCADWPKESQKLAWKEAGFGEPPSLSSARENISKFSFGHHVDLVEMDDSLFLNVSHDKLDFIYIDTSHDYETVARQIRQVKPLCAGPHTIIAGDDYSNAGTWGVRTAVAEGFTSHEVFADWIWISDASRLKP